MTTETYGGIEATLPAAVAADVRDALARWDAESSSARLWGRDATLWTGGAEGRWLGWLEPGAGADPAALAALAAEVEARGVRAVVLVGMGGSSLGAEVIASTIHGRGGRTLIALDTTDPDEIRAAEAGLDLARTLYVVASKSGTTIESVSLEEYFWRRLESERERARSFVAITDPGTVLETRARERGYHLFLGVPEIGGRFSALSPYGLVPAAALGGDIEPLLGGARAAVARSGPAVPAAESPGVALGILLAELARAGHDKLTLHPRPELALLGPWLEQLIAESTGKGGSGILPIAGEERLAEGAYGRDRVLVEWGGSRARASAAGGDRSPPLLRLPAPAPEDLGGELVRWELATAVAGAGLGLDPFDQPDVDAAKVAARRRVGAAREGGAEPPAAPLHASAEWRWQAAGVSLDRLRAVGTEPAAILDAHLASLGDGDFFALLAYLPRSGGAPAILERARRAVAVRHRVATSLGFGPRYLHSTGQYFKGGPNRGVYLFVTRRIEDDLPIPGQHLGFGALQRAQALGDLEVLAERGRRVLHVEIGDELEPGLDRLAALLARL